VATHAAAGWQSKPYNTWTDAELKEVLTDSPWASKASISYVKTNGANSGAIEDMALVSWVSSLPLRQAGVRQQIAVGSPIPKEAEAALATPAQAYVVAVKVFGGTGSSSYANGASTAQADTFLLRDGKPPIAAVQSEGRTLDKDDKVIETPAGGAPRGAGGGAPRSGAPANAPFFDIQRGGGGAGGFGAPQGGFGAPQGGGGNRPRGVASLLVYVFPKTDPITLADKEVEFSSKLCGGGFGGFGGGGGGGGFGGAPAGGGPANAPLFEMQRGGGGGGFGGGGGAGAPQGRPGGGAPTPACRFNVKKKFKLKDLVYNGDLSL
jgi:translation initiation factor IF-2